MKNEVGARVEEGFSLLLLEPDKLQEGGIKFKLRQAAAGYRQTAGLK